MHQLAGLLSNFQDTGTKSNPTTDCYTNAPQWFSRCSVATDWSWL